MSSTAVVAEKYKIKDLSLADWGRQEIILAEKEMPGLMALREKIWQRKTFERSSHRRVSPYDHSNGRVDRNSSGAGSGSALGILQHIFNTGPCGRGHS